MAADMQLREQQGGRFGAVQQVGETDSTQALNKGNMRVKMLGKG